MKVFVLLLALNAEDPALTESAEPMQPPSCDQRGDKANQHSFVRSAREPRWCGTGYMTYEGCVRIGTGYSWDCGEFDWHAPLSPGMRQHN